MCLETYSAFTVEFRKRILRFSPNLFDILKLRCKHLPRCPSLSGRDLAYYALDASLRWPNGTMENPTRCCKGGTQMLTLIVAGLSAALPHILGAVGSLLGAVI